VSSLAKAFHVLGMAHSVTRAVGIDLGTTFTVVASLDSAGKPVTIPNGDGDPTTASAAYFGDTAIAVGKQAILSGLRDPGRLAQAVKRDMGKSVCSVPINGQYYPPEVIQSLILEKARRDAQAKVGPFEKCVITVPAYFNEPRRRATQDAGRLAGLDVLDIINEPTAAAIAYGFANGFLNTQGESKRPERVLVYDLGGGTFDATLMAIDGKSYTVLATDGDVKLGGLDWDARIVDFLAAQFVTAHRFDPRTIPNDAQRLALLAEMTKRGLSAQDQVEVLMEHAGHRLTVPFDREQFETLTADLLERTRFTVSQLLRQAKIQWHDVNRVLLVGGSTRMPMVPRMLERETGRTIDKSLAADEAVAHGAAIYANLLLKSAGAAEPDFTITNVSSHNLGVLGVEPETGRPQNRVRIHRNTPLPISKSKGFCTRRKGQRSIAVQVIEGGDASGNHSTPIGKCVIRDLPPDLPAATRVVVAFSYESNGRLAVHARVPEIGRESRIDIERSSGMTDQTLDEWGRQVRDRCRPLHLRTDP
jgi:molecular chaperone DnaK